MMKAMTRRLEQLQQSRQVTEAQSLHEVLEMEYFYCLSEYLECRWEQGELGT